MISLVKMVSDIARLNGLAETFVQTFKMAMKKMSTGGGDN